MSNKMNCGDWHLGWGYGGHDKVGRLTDNGDGTFTWKGRSQGRHGSKWNYGAFVTFKLLDGEIEVIDSKGGYPVTKELVTCAEELTSKASRTSTSRPRKVKSPPPADAGKQSSLFDMGETKIMNDKDKKQFSILSENLKRLENVQHNRSGLTKQDTGEVLMIKVRNFPYYLRRVDSKHVKIVSTIREAREGIGGTDHINKFCAKPFYDDISKWLTGDLTTKELYGKKY